MNVDLFNPPPPSLSLFVDIVASPFTVSKGIIVQMLARADTKVVYANGEKSKLDFHGMPDGAAVIPLDTGYGMCASYAVQPLDLTLLNSQHFSYPVHAQST